jgi:PKD repeat protein
MHTFRRGVSRLVAALVIGAMVAPLAAMSDPAAAATPSAAFDHSMPDRFGLDRNTDGITDYVDGATDTATGYDATPSSWRVDLDACASQADAAMTFQWRVVDQPDPANPIVVQGGPDCADFYMDVPEEGTYRVDLVVESGGVSSAVVRREVVVQDWLIVALGDSYGSGEGAPDVPIDQSKLYEVEGAWADVGVKLQALVTIEADMAPIQAAIARWQDAVGQLYRCDPTHPDADVGLCAAALASIAVESVWVVGELIAYGIAVVGETVSDAGAAVSGAIDAVRTTWEAAVQLADSITGKLSATWQAERCHRSARSGSAKAAQALEEADPRTSVTFVHLACSGATVTYGLLGWYQGTEHPDGVTNEACADAASRPAACLPPQVDVAEQLVADREVDAVYVSVGGNDAHFADIVIACIIQSDCSTENPISDPGQFLATACPDLAALGAVPLLLTELCRSFFLGLPSLMDTAADLIEEGINGDVRAPILPEFPGLAVAYGRLDDALTGATNLLPASRADRIFLSQYVDAVKNDVGSLCDWDTMSLDSIPGLSAVESAYIDSTIVPRLTDAIEQATVTHGWTYVDGVYDGFTNHGYCADEHYIVRLQETFLSEGRFHGMVHPNSWGYDVYANSILTTWRNAFYPTGSLTSPRRPDQAAFADAGQPVTVAEGGSVALPNESWDSDGDAMTFSWTHDQPGKANVDVPTSSAPNLEGIDDAAGNVTVTVTDADGTRSDATSFAVTNVAPVLGATSSLDAPVALGTAVAGSVGFTDAGTADTHTGTWDWGDGTTSAATIDESGGTGTAKGTHTYAAAGLYPVQLTVTDDDGGVASLVHEFVVVFDASGGFATGGGWFDSPAGAYTPDDPSDADLGGRARFAFVSKYANRATTPSGTTSFRLVSADLDFESSAYEWMVISGAKVTYRGTGLVNGQPGYRFVLVATDGDARGVTASADQIRIRIWHGASGDVVYDNQPGDGIDAPLRTTVGGGSITVHKSS